MQRVSRQQVFVQTFMRRVRKSVPKNPNLQAARCAQICVHNFQQERYTRAVQWVKSVCFQLRKKKIIRSYY